MPSSADFQRPDAARAFTLLEVIMVILVVAILGVMLFPVISTVQGRMERAKCIGNLHSLHLATTLYMQDHSMWPQLAITDGMEEKQIASLWISTLQPYNVQQINWICPTVQRLLQNPDLSDSNNVRLDYSATSFDEKQQSPFRWSTQPWFVEGADVHGNGNLVIFPDGHVVEMNEMRSH